MKIQRPRRQWLLRVITIGARVFGALCLVAGAAFLVTAAVVDGGLWYAAFGASSIVCGVAFLKVRGLTMDDLPPDPRGTVEVSKLRQNTRRTNV